MLISVLLFAVGLVLLIKGGDWFVDGATGIAKRFNEPVAALDQQNKTDSKQQDRNKHTNSPL